VALLLDQRGFSEVNLQTAWREKTNQEVAATILGFIRQAALGDPLRPYTERVDRALAKLLARRAWTQPQRTWLQRIGKQLAQEKVVDRASLDEGQFATHGGFQRLNKVFDGQLEALLSELGESIWEQTG
jgi:type I restriction enzyme, R subunit